LSTILPAVEQSTGSNTQPLHAVGADPAFIPGITPPRSKEPDDDAPELTAAEEVPKDSEESEPTAEAEGVDAADTADLTDAADPADAPEDTTAEKASTPAAESKADEADPADPADESAPDPEDKADGPVFTASDRRGSITADKAGVRLRLDDQEADFRWDEIGAVEIDISRFGRRFTVTVHTPGNRWYPGEVQAQAKSDLEAWTTELDAVLDAYFEDA
jgi:hypothetical protein